MYIVERFSVLAMYLLIIIITVVVGGGGGGGGGVITGQERLLLETHNMIRTPNNSIS